jgi:hypothetical protein
VFYNTNTTGGQRAIWSSVANSVSSNFVIGAGVGLALNGSTSGYVGLAAAAAAGSTTYTLPSADGTSGQALTTNGSGTLSWATSGPNTSAQYTWSNTNTFSGTLIASQGITFGDGTKTTTDLGRPFTERFGGFSTVYDEYTYNWKQDTPNNNRNVRYITRYYQVCGSNIQADNTQITVYNYSGSTLRINVIHGLHDQTDDTSSWILYRGGTIVNSSTHSGGTTVYDSGAASRGTGLSTVTTTQDIAPNTTATFYLYAGVFGGSSFDAVAGYIRTSFNSWV